MAKLKPLAGYVLIEPLEEEETTASGLVMPEKAKEKPAKGKIVAIGPIPMETMKEIGSTHMEDYLNIAVSDIVVFQRWAGQDVREGQKELRLVKFQDLMAVYG